MIDPELKYPTHSLPPSMQMRVRCIGNPFYWKFTDELIRTESAVITAPTRPLLSPSQDPKNLQSPTHTYTPSCCPERHMLQGAGSANEPCSPRPCSLAPSGPPCLPCSPSLSHPGLQPRVPSCPLLWALTSLCPRLEWPVSVLPVGGFLSFRYQLECHFLSENNLNQSPITIFNL